MKRNKIDVIVEKVISDAPYSCKYQELCDVFSNTRIDELICIGVLKKIDNLILLDAPVFLEDELIQISYKLKEEAENIFKKFISFIDEINRMALRINNNFSIKRNLYHIICGMIFDDKYLDYLAGIGLLRNSKIHLNKLDYVLTIYEKTSKLERFSKQLLCSYNCFGTQDGALLSFGDANGSRHDFFRCNLPADTTSKSNKNSSEYEKHLWYLLNQKSDNCKNYLIRQTRQFITCGVCDEICLKLLELYDYAEHGQICVPVLDKECYSVAYQIESLVEQNLTGAFKCAFENIHGKFKMTSLKHGVPVEEINNEIYHILFGMLNEKLVDEEIVSKPTYKPGEGRYFKAVDVYS